YVQATELYRCVLGWIPSQFPACGHAILRKNRNGAGSIARSKVVKLLLVSLQRNREIPAHLYGALRSSAQPVHRPVSAIEERERCNQRHDDTSHPLTHF